MAVADPEPSPGVLLFRRDYHGPSGGHLKVWHYYLHARESRRFTPRLFVTPASLVDDVCPWRGVTTLADWRPGEAAALFVAGLDWEALPDDPGCPVINLVQGVRHADPADPRYRYLARPAVRICVSAEVARAITATGIVNGPAHVIPAALDPADLPPPATARDIPVLVAGAKQPALARDVAARLRDRGLAVTCLTTALPRRAFLDHLARAEVAVLLPLEAEGFFLPALEALALGALVVCPDCIGNRAICRDRVTALVPAFDAGAIAEAAREALALPAATRRALRTAAASVVARHGPDEERRAFLAILDSLPPTGGRP